MMKEFPEAMRLGRWTRTELEKNHAAQQREVGAVDPRIKGSPLYTETVEKINQKHEAERKRIAEKSRADAKTIIDRIRENVYSHVSKAPSTDQVNTLQVLRTLDTITAREMQIYAEQMSSSPLAMKSLSQIARDHKIHVETLDTDRLIEAVNTLAWHLNAISHYSGDEPHAPASLRIALKYFESDRDYQRTNTPGGTREADLKFWEDVVQYGDPRMLDAEGSYKPASPKYFFKNLDEMIEYMKQAAEGLDEGEAEKVQTEILINSPTQYGAVYRNYKATGEKLPLINN